jgi:hypothetical protein
MSIVYVLLTFLHYAHCRTFKHAKSVEGIEVKHISFVWLCNLVSYSQEGK